MRQAWSQAEWDLASSRRQRARWYLAIHKPQTLATYSIDAIPDTHPVSAIEVTNVSGTLSAASAGLTVWVGTDVGLSDLGRIRLRKQYVETNPMHVMESGSGLVRWNDATHLTVKTEFRPWVKHPRYDTAASSWKMDYDIAYDDELEIYAPLAVMGAPFVKILDDSGTTNGSFVGEHSISWDSSITDYLWTFPDEQTSTGAGTEGAPVQMTFTGASPNGEYFSLRVTNANGKEHTGYRLMWAFDNLADLPRVGFTQIQGGTEQGGYITQIQAYNLSDDDIAPGAEVVIFEAASYGDTASELGGNSPFRNNVVFRGWVTDEQITKDPKTGMTVFKAETIDGIMKNAPSYDVFYAMIDGGNDGITIPSGSYWIATSPFNAWLTIDRVALNMMRWRSNVGDVCDFFPAGGVANVWPIVFQNLPRADWWTQLRTNYNERGLLYHVASDLQSAIHAFPNYNITGGSASAETFPIMSASNVSNQVVIERTFHEEVAQLQLYGVASTTPWGAESPGNVFGYAGGKQEITQGLLTLNQQTLVTWSGNIRADRNAEFKRVVTPLAGNMRIDPIPHAMQPITIDMTNHGKRLNWTAKYFQPFEVAITYQPGESVLVELVSKEVVDGKGGSAITFPTIVPLSPPTAPPPVSPPGPSVGSDTVYVMGDNFLGRTRDFNSQVPTWSTVSLGSAYTERYYDFILDSWNPKNSAYLSTDNGLYKTSNLDSNSPTWSLVLSRATIEANSGGDYRVGYKVMTSINVENYVVLFYEGFDGALYCAYSYDAGSSWGYQQIDAQGQNISFGGAADYVPHIVNGGIMLYALGGEFTGSPPQYRPKMFRSSDGGDTWSARGSIGSYVLGYSQIATWTVHCPYTGNEDGQLVYAATQNGTYKSTDGGLTWTSLGIIPETAVSRHAIETWTQDNQILYVWDNSSTLQVSTNGGTSFSARATVSSAQIKGVGGFPFENSTYYAVTRDGIYYSVDGGNNFYTKTGNYPIASLSGTASANKAVIVPLWIE